MAAGGAVLCWGANNYGQLGYATAGTCGSGTLCSNTPGSSGLSHDTGAGTIVSKGKRHAARLHAALQRVGISVCRVGEEKRSTLGRTRHEKRPRKARMMHRAFRKIYTPEDALSMLVQMAHFACTSVRSV